MRLSALVEKCARWHAYCSERLCEEDYNIFDQRVNTENLTKCLESLKQFYHDLSLKNIFCENEAEFRSYVVLLNLNDGDSLRIVQNLRPEVRSAEVVQTAVEIYFALNRNNYVRFFRLVKGKASFLQACIAHRYFAQIRSEGIKRILNVYTPGKTSCSFPLSRIVGMLGFEDEAEAEAFCVSHDLKVAGDVVILQRSSFVEPEGFTPKRAQMLIESKMAGISVGDIVNGGLPVPPAEIREPSCSFDANGLFIQDLKEDAGIEEGEVTPSTSSTSNASSAAAAETGSADDSASAPAREAASPAPREPAVEKEAIFHQVVDDLIGEVTRDTVEDIFSEFRMLDGVINRIVDEIVFEAADEKIQLAVRELVTEMEEEEERETREKLLLAMRKAEEAKRFEAEEEKDAEAKALDRVVAEILDGVTVEMSRETAVEEMSLVESTLHSRFVDSLSLQIHGEIVTSVCGELTLATANECHRDLVTNVLHSLVDVKERRESRIARNAFERWRSCHRRKMRKRAALETLPPAPNADDGVVAALTSNLPAELRAKPLGETLDRIGEKMSDKIALRLFTQQKIRRETLAPFDLAEIFGRELAGRVGSTGRVYLKVVILTPDAASGDAASGVDNSNWFLKKLRKGQVAPEINRKYDLPGTLDTLAYYTTGIPSHSSSSSSFSSSSGRKFTFCLKCLRGSIPAEAGFHLQRLLSGTRALLLSISDGSQILESIRLLDQVFDAKVSTPAVPLLVCFFPAALRDYDVSEVSALETHLQSLVDRGFVSAFDSASLTSADSISSLENNEAVQKALIRLSKLIPDPPKIERRLLQDLVDGSIVKGVFEPFSQDLDALARSKGLHPSANRLIRLHNRVLDSLVEGIERIQSESLCWPMVEMENLRVEIPFDWNSSFRLIDLANAVAKLRLPSFSARGHVTLSNDNDDATNFDGEWGGEWAGENALTTDETSMPPHFDYASLGWSEAKELVWEFVSSVLENGENLLSMQLLSKIQWLLEKTERKFKQKLEDQLLPLGEKERRSLGEPCWENLPWIDIIIGCINYKVSANPCLSADGEELEIFLTADSRTFLESAVDGPKKRLAAAEDDGSTADLALTVDETLEKSIKRKRDAVFAAAKTSESSKKSAKMMDLRLDRNSPTLRPLNTSLTGLSRRVSLEKNVMDDYERWLTAAAAMPALAATDAQAVSPAAAMKSGEKRLSIGEKRHSIGEKRHSIGEKRLSVGEAPVSHLLDALKREVEAAKLREKMFEIDLTNMVAGDDVI